jgi:hypothetical protein
VLFGMTDKEQTAESQESWVMQINTKIYESTNTEDHISALIEQINN